MAKTEIQETYNVKLEAFFGLATAAKLTSEQRRASAQHAANARWSEARATHVGVLNIGALEIPCAVLQDGRRVIVQSGLMTALGRKKLGDNFDFTEDTNFLAADNLKPFLDEANLISPKPISFVP